MMSAEPISVAEVNGLTEESFVEHFGGVLEGSSTYAAQVARGRPFADVQEMVAAFAAAVWADSPGGQLALIRAHPDLAGKAAVAGELTPESAGEQRSAGLDRLTPGEYRRFQVSNAAYTARFGMPLVVCAREHTAASILDWAEERLSHTPEQERQTALGEIVKIAGLRLRDLVREDLPAPTQSSPVPAHFTDPNATFRSRFRLGEHNYGKSDIRLVRVDRREPRHLLKDVRVDVALEGDFAAAHVAGDNRALPATDTMRNTVYALAQKGLDGSVELFGRRLVRHFLEVSPAVRRVRIHLTEHRWERMTVGGVPHDHSFVRMAGEHRATVENTVEGDGRSLTLSSAVAELTILKTTQSGWEDFSRGEYATLPDTDDRVLATVANVTWEYTAAAAGDKATDHDRIWAGVLEQLQASFSDHYSPSMQYTLYRIGSALLERFPEIGRVHLSFPNRHHLLYNLERFGMRNDKTSPVQVLHADPEPYGLIEGWVERE